MNVKADKSDLPQGTLDLLILKVVTLGPVHGYAIAQRLQQVSRDVVQVPQGSLYPALHRLENRGLLAADWKETETGREAKFYRLTRKGRAQLEAETASWQRLTEAVGLILKLSPKEAPNDLVASPRRRRLMEEQLEKELSFHLEQHTSDLVARGHDLEAARRQARLAIGGSRAGEGAVPRRARHALAGGFVAGSPLCASQPAAEARVCGRYAVDPGARHRRHHRHVHGGQWRSTEAAALSRARTGWWRFPGMWKRKRIYGEQNLAYPDFLDCQRESRSLDMAGWVYNGHTQRTRRGRVRTAVRDIVQSVFASSAFGCFVGAHFFRRKTGPAERPWRLSVTACGSATSPETLPRLGCPWFWMESAIPSWASRPPAFQLDGEKQTCIRRWARTRRSICRIAGASGGRDRAPPSWCDTGSGAD